MTMGAVMPARRLLAIMLILAVAGCSVVNPTSPAEQASMDAITTQIQHTLEQRPDVASADVSYQNSLDASARADATMQVKAGVAIAPVLDDAERLIWLSHLGPLSSINVSANDITNPQRGEIRNLNLLDPATKQDLQSRYGPRPVK